jgi:hypothetical protein
MPRRIIKSKKGRRGFPTAPSRLYKSPQGLYFLDKNNKRVYPSSKTLGNNQVVNITLNTARRRTNGRIKPIPVNPPGINVGTALKYLAPNVISDPATAFNTAAISRLTNENTKIGKQLSAATTLLNSFRVPVVPPPPSSAVVPPPVVPPQPIINIYNKNKQPPPLVPPPVVPPPVVPPPVVPPPRVVPVLPPAGADIYDFINEELKKKKKLDKFKNKSEDEIFDYFAVNSADPYEIYRRVAEYAQDDYIDKYNLVAEDSASDALDVYQPAARVALPLPPSAVLKPSSDDIPDKEIKKIKHNELPEDLPESNPNIDVEQLPQQLLKTMDENRIILESIYSGKQFKEMGFNGKSKYDNIKKLFEIINKSSESDKARALGYLPFLRQEYDDAILKNNPVNYGIYDTQKEFFEFIKQISKPKTQKRFTGAGKLEIQNLLNHMYASRDDLIDYLVFLEKDRKTGPSPECQIPNIQLGEPNQEGEGMEVLDSSPRSETERANPRLHGLTNKEIEQFAEDLRIKNFLGVFPYDQIGDINPPKHSSFSLIYNTDKTGNPGIHWIGAYYDRPRASLDIFDSFADPVPDNVLDQFEKLIEKLNLDYYVRINENKERDQRINSKLCGLFALDFINKRSAGIPFRIAEAYGGGIIGAERYLVSRFAPRQEGEGRFLDAAKRVGTDAIKAANSSIRKIADVSKQKAQETIARADTIASSIVPALGGIRNDYQPKAREIIADYGDYYITAISVGRKPIQAAITKLGNLATGGELLRAIKRVGYDSLFHLYSIITLRPNTLQGKGAGLIKLVIEKNDVINISESLPAVGKDTEMITVSSVSSGTEVITLKEFLERTRHRMGDKKYFSYDAGNNNCQTYITNLLKANNLGTQKDFEFIQQPTAELLEGFPALKKIIDVATNLGARVDLLTKGAGQVL